MNDPTADDTLLAADKSGTAWLSFHIFYAGSPRPLIAGCLEPLIERLRADSLITRWFFINYWLEGPHVRLRLRPLSAEVSDTVRDVVIAAVTEFLASRPALYRVDEDEFGTQSYDVLFRLEYSDSDRAKAVDHSGRMIVQANNSIAERSYEPEFARYGGPVGMELSEWHFERSSDLVTSLITRGNLHVRSRLLGVAARAMETMAWCFLGTPELAAEFYLDYLRHWQSSFHGTDYLDEAEYDKPAELVQPSLTSLMQQTRTAVDEARAHELPGFQGEWARHCLDLRARIVAAAQAGSLVFDSRAGVGQEVVTDPHDALERLLFSYVHMTNNRLYVLIPDEVYLAYAFSRCTPLGEGLPR